MKLTQFWKDSRPALGLLTGEGTVDVSAEAARRGVSAPATALEAVQGGQAARAVLEELSRNARCFVPAGAPAAPVITGMDKVLCIGLNYRRHAMECNLPIPERPVLFNKFPSTLSACGDTILLQKGYVEYDYEAELVAVIQKSHEEGMTFLLIEHNMDVVMNVSDDISVLSFGRLIAKGEPNAIKNNDEVITAYLGRAFVKDQSEEKNQP